MRGARETRERWRWKLACSGLRSGTERGCCVVAGGGEVCSADDCDGRFAGVGHGVEGAGRAQQPDAAVEAAESGVGCAGG
eukprot:3531676-Rhodomonas_salina.4